MTTAAKDEQAVLVFLKLSDGSFGEFEEREAIFDLEDKLQSAISQGGIGEYDGHEFGDGWGKLYLYGPDARIVRQSIEKMLREFGPRQGSYVIERYGGPGAREERISL